MNASEIIKSIEAEQLKAVRIRPSLKGSISARISVIHLYLLSHYRQLSATVPIMPCYIPRFLIIVYLHHAQVHLLL